MWRIKTSYSARKNVILLCLFTLSLSACRTEVEVEKDDTPKLALVEVLPIQTSKHQIMIRSQGLAQPKIETQLVSEVSGVIKKITPTFVKGGMTQAEDILISIDNINYQAIVRRAEANLAAQKARLTEEEARAKTERQSWTRSGRSLDSAPALVLRQPQIREIKANIKAANAELQQARSNLNKTQIKAPYRGIISDRLVDLGQYVTVGTALGSTFSTDAIEVRLPLSRKDLDLLGIPLFGQFTPETAQLYPVTLTNNGVTWQAQMVRSEGFQDQQTRLHYVIAEVKNPYGLNENNNLPSLPNNPIPLIKGVFVEAEIKGKAIDNVAAIPRNLLRRANQVLTIDSANKLQLKSVTPLYYHGDIAYINAGLNTGDRLVLTAIQTPIVGTEVIVHKPNNKTTTAAANTPTITDHLQTEEVQ